MGRHNQSGKRFRARAARRPLRFWWQPFALLGVTVLLWSHLPVNAVLFEPRVLAPPPEPRAAYVVLAPEEAAQALANMRASWRTSGSAADIELGVFDVLEEQNPPAFLEQGARYPGVWQPATIEPLDQVLPEIAVSAFPEDPFAHPLPTARNGVVAVVSGTLRNADFSFVPPSGPLPVRSGECRFFVETDAAGAVTHVLLLTPANEATAALERALQRGTAHGEAHGLVTLTWRFAP